MEIEAITKDGEVIPLSRDLGLRGRVLQIGWELPDDLSEIEWKAAGEILGKVERAVQWWLGDWWAYAEARYGERKAITEADDWEGPHLQTCADAAMVCRKFETSRRREVLSFTHHREVASLESDQADKLLDWCEEPIASSGRPRSTRELREAVEALKKGIPNRTSFTGNNEWYTPEAYLDAARDVLGAFDLDPATNEIAQQKVKADNYFTADDDGLAHEWFGRVWLNPPYAQPAIEDFADKMIAEVDAKRVSAAIMLTHNYTDTAWFQKAARSAKAMCFTRGRIRFESPTGELAAPTQGQTFFYYGDDVEAFRERFANVGFVVEVLE